MNLAPATGQPKWAGQSRMSSTLKPSNTPVTSSDVIRR